MIDLELIINFVNGNINIEDFIFEFNQRESLRLLLQNKLPETLYEQGEILRANGSIIECFEKINCKIILDAYTMHALAVDWCLGNNIEVIPTETYRKAFIFLISVKPDYINGEKAESLIQDILQSFPETMPKTKRIKEIKAKIKEAFHVEDRKYPRWAQDTDWPFSKMGKPLKYVSRKTDGDLVQHTFVDVDTGEETIVEEFY